MFNLKSLHAYLPESLDQLLFRSFRSSKCPPVPLPSTRRSAQCPQLPITRINTMPIEILHEVFLFVVVSSLYDYDSCLECRRRVHPESQVLITHSPSVILSHVCKRWRDIMLAYPLFWSFISDQDLCCEKWMSTVLSRLWGVTLDNTAPLLTIRLRICSRLRQNQIGRQLGVLRFLIRRSSSRIKHLSVGIAEDDAFAQLFDGGWGHEGLLSEDFGWGRRKENPKWSKNLEELHISSEVPCGGPEKFDEDFLTDFKKEEDENRYISYLNFHHTPIRSFMSHERPEFVSIFRDYIEDDESQLIKPEYKHQSRLSRLRKLSLINCSLLVGQLGHFKNVEDLTVMHAQSTSLDSSLFWYWDKVVYCLPRLKRLAIDGVVESHPEDLGFEVSLPLLAWKKRSKFEPCSKSLEELNINRCSPFFAARMLHFFSEHKWLRKLQITCTKIEYDKGFKELCKAVRAWSNRWNSWTYRGGRGGYLYLSIGPSGLIIHNRRVNLMESNDADQETRTTTDQEEPEIQLTLYSVSTLELDLIVDVLDLISPTPAEFGLDTAGPFVVSCEELELSIGLFDLEDDSFKKVFNGLVDAFGKVKRLKKFRCVGSATAQLLLARESEGLALLPTLETLYLDHVDFSNLDQAAPQMVSNVPNRVELIRCRNVCRELVSKLQRIGIDVFIGRGTNIIEGRKRGKKVEKEQWTSEQVKTLMNKWADEARPRQPKFRF